MKGRIGPYRISERLGTGGMGEVFKAFDDRLDRWVAIKRIRPGKEDTDENRERFQREARATAQLNHPAIVHVYDIFRDGESDCIVMEYIEGRSLQSIAAEGPLDPIHAAALGQEIADGLAAAHAKGILHRDLKTENIIVTPDGHAKVLDFGLAKPLISDELDSSLTGKGQLVGTSRSMSPEYVGGDNVDHRSDLFALGVMLYEIVSGHSPFKAQNTLATLKQVIVHQQAPVREMNPDVPEELSDLIDELLQKSPDDRPQSAKEVAHALAQISGQMPSSGSVSRSSLSDTHVIHDGEWSISTTVIDPRLRRYWIGLGVILVGSILAAYLVGTRQKPVDIEVPTEDGEPVSVVLAFENLTNEEVLDKSLELVFRLGLERSRQVRVLTDSQIRTALKRMQRDEDTELDRELGIEISQRENAHAVVVGSIGKVGDSYTLGAMLIDPVSQQSVYSASPTTVGSQNDIIRSFEAMIQEIRVHLGEVSTSEDAVPLDQVTTSNFQALRAYSLGLTELGRGRYLEAVPLLERAVALDPEFAMAHARLGAILLNLQQDKAAEEHLELARKHKDRLTEFEELYIEGNLARSRGTPEDMVEAWSLLSDIYPERHAGHHNLGMAYLLYMNDFEKAAAAFEIAIQVQGQRVSITSYNQLSYSYLGLGRFGDALGVFEKAPDYESPRFLQRKAEALIASGRYDEAEEIEDALLARQGAARRTGFMLEIWADVDRGDLAVALATVREMESQGHNGTITEKLASEMAMLAILEPLGEDARWREILTPMVELVAGAITDITTESPELSPIPSLVLIGKMAARNGALDEAEKLGALTASFARESRFPIWRAYAMMLESEIALAHGEPGRAAARLREDLEGTLFLAGKESLARMEAAAGNIDQAIVNYEWVIENRGRVFAECQFNCFDRTVNLADWGLAHFELAKLHDQRGNHAEAQAAYRRFLKVWSKGEATPQWKHAKARLEILAN